MNGPEPLDLSQVDPATWRVFVNETAYGPYTLGQIRSFVVEGRIAQRTKIAEGNGAPVIEAGACSKLASAFAEVTSPQSTESLSNFVIIAHLLDGDRKLVSVLNQIGTFGEAMPGVFLLRSALKLSEIQSLLRDVTDSEEKFMIVDASNNRLAWLGLGPDANTHMQSIWNKAA